MHLIWSNYSRSPSYCECVWWRRLVYGSLRWSLGGGYSHGCRHPSAGSPAVLCSAVLGGNMCFPLLGSASEFVLIQRTEYVGYINKWLQNVNYMSCCLTVDLIWTHPLMPLKLSIFLNRHAECKVVRANINASKWKQKKKCTEHNKRSKLAMHIFKTSSLFTY